MNSNSEMKLSFVQRLQLRMWNATFFKIDDTYLVSLGNGFQVEAQDFFAFISNLFKSKKFKLALVLVCFRHLLTAMLNFASSVFCLMGGLLFFWFFYDSGNLFIETIKEIQANVYTPNEIRLGVKGQFKVIWELAFFIYFSGYLWKVLNLYNGGLDRSVTFDGEKLVTFLSQYRTINRTINGKERLRELEFKQVRIKGKCHLVNIEYSYIEDGVVSYGVVSNQHSKD